MQETLITTLSGFAPLMQSVGASLYISFVTAIATASATILPSSYPVSIVSISSWICSNPTASTSSSASYPHQPNQGPIPPYDHQYLPPPFYVQHHNPSPVPRPSVFVQQVSLDLTDNFIFFSLRHFLKVQENWFMIYVNGN